MKTHSILTLAIAATLSTPIAFAQSDSGTSDTLGSQQGTTAQQQGQSTEQQDSSMRNDRAQTQGAAQAATHSMEASRAVWATLDTDGDGRISRTEGEVDASFKSNFVMMDADKDGYVSDAEYRAHAKDDMQHGKEKRDDKSARRDK